jgi:hypothetical protein
MAELDSPLKQLVSAFIIDFAAWLLHADVREAHPLNVELPSSMLTATRSSTSRWPMVGRSCCISSFKGEPATSP